MKPALRIILVILSVYCCDTFACQPTMSNQEFLYQQRDKFHTVFIGKITDKSHKVNPSTQSKTYFYRFTPVNIRKGQVKLNARYATSLHFQLGEYILVYTDNNNNIIFDNNCYHISKNLGKLSPEQIDTEISKLRIGEAIDNVIYQELLWAQTYIDKKLENAELLNEHNRYWHLKQDQVNNLLKGYFKNHEENE